MLILSPVRSPSQNQDHYAVLGLSKYRFRATEEQIKRAHRKKVLRHHPDKKAAAGNVDDDSFFKCIQKATEVLLDPIRRRQFDSVDEGADVDPPSKKETQKGDFFKLWTPVFESEARFSVNQPVLALGNDDSTKEQVEKFYDFWYNFNSWRSFEYLDEDVPDDNESRDQKRHIERKNQNARKKRKTEDTARLRKLVDVALSLDERIKRFQKQSSAQKNRKRLEKEAELKRAAEEAARKKEEDERAKVKREAAEKVEKAEAKKRREAAKTAAKKNKRVIRASVKDANYFLGEGEPSAAQIDGALNDADLLIQTIDLEELAELTSRISLVKNPVEIREVFAEEVKRLVGAGKLKEGAVKSLS